ncbi:hypothetical protein HOS13_gp29 [Caulobacter phage Lullwater]|uniref:Uncharacterized protein n=1 Tax=Caulobacter phage Lullwater TaxID=2024607 RepID=A0A291LB95_9CAUD|nr:hypothetical protein HOS13_gp29 [Caulobacter phage Lullwater]ATI16336.1 hypothetical protein Lull_029 [Caulobacter phage Lullwater]
MSTSKAPYVPHGRIIPQDYDKLETKVKAAFNVVPKSDIEAGMMLGVQHVLDQLRKDFVVGS